MSEATPNTSDLKFALPRAAPPGTEPGSRTIGPALSLAKREIVRFLRQPSRLLGGLATPVVFWLFLGSGFGQSFRMASEGPPGDYLAYFYAGALVLLVMFTAIFSMISLIQDRNEGFMQGVLIAPVPRIAIALGKILGATGLAVGQAVLFLALAPLAGISTGFFHAVAACGVIAVVGLGLSALGFVVAWRMDSVQGFHSVMNLVLMPMWLLSGAVFPSSGASGWVRWLMAINPLTYGVAWLRAALGEASADSSVLRQPLASGVITLALVVSTVLLAAWSVSRPKS